MAEVILTPKGLFCKDEDKWERPKKLAILSYLPDRCRIKEGTTLRDIFKIVDRYKLLKIFIRQYSGCPQIEEFHKQAQEKISVTEDDNLLYLEIYWDADLSKYKKELSFDIGVGFHGIGKDPDKPKDDNVTTKYSVSYSPMHTLAHLPIRLNTKFSLYEPWKGKPPQEKMFEAKKDFSLLDVLNGIYWDISFMGGPEENKEFLEEMRQRVEDIKSGKEKCIPIEEAFPELAEELKKEEEEENGRS